MHAEADFLYRIRTFSDFFYRIRASPNELPIEKKRYRCVTFEVSNQMQDNLETND